MSDYKRYLLVVTYSKCGWIDKYVTCQKSREGAVQYAEEMTDYCVPALGNRKIKTIEINRNGDPI